MSVLERYPRDTKVTLTVHPNNGFPKIWGIIAGNPGAVETERFWGSLVAGRGGVNITKIRMADVVSEQNRKVTRGYLMIFLDCTVRDVLELVQCHTQSLSPRTNGGKRLVTEVARLTEATSGTGSQPPSMPKPKTLNAAPKPLIAILIEPSQAPKSYAW
jgi:hypothetical protein